MKSAVSMRRANLTEKGNGGITINVQNTSTSRMKKSDVETGSKYMAKVDKGRRSLKHMRSKATKTTTATMMKRTKK